MPSRVAAVAGVIFGMRACTRDGVRATVAGCRDTGHDTTDHSRSLCDDTLPVAGAGSPVRCKQPDPGDNGTTRRALGNMGSGEGP